VSILKIMASAALMAAIATGADAATLYYNTQLRPISPGTTTTTATGTQSTNAGSGLAGESIVAGDWEQQNVRSNGVVGITTDYARSGNGSIFFSTDGSVGSKADMEFYLSTPELLSDFTGATYDWLRDGASTVGPAPAPALRLLVTNAQGGFASLVFEPYNQSPGDVPTNAWQTSTFDMSTGALWATGSKFVIPGPGAGPSCQSCLHTVGEWAAANAGAHVIGFSTGVGSGWTGGDFVGAVDNIGFTFKDGGQSFNFEVGGVPEPATWAMLILGFGMVGAMARSRGRRIQRA
jgi:hypothetical protein